MGHLDQPVDQLCDLAGYVTFLSLIGSRNDARKGFSELVHEVLSTWPGIQQVLSKWRLVRTQPTCCQGAYLHEADGFPASGTLACVQTLACGSIFLSLRQKGTECGRCSPLKGQSFYVRLSSLLGFPSGSDGKESACSAGDRGSTPGQGRSPGEGNGYPLQYSCLENPIDRGTWAVVHGVAKSKA